MDQEVAWIRSTLANMALGDIKRAADGKAKMGAFILASCFIDCLAGFKYGRKTRGRDYQSFVKAYLPGYDAVKLYEDLRCKLVHNYTAGADYWFVDGKSSWHLKRINYKTCINLEDFVSDVENAMCRLLTEIENDGAACGLAKKRLREIGLLAVQQLTIRAVQ